MTFPEFYSGKKVLITGHTGFKGGWLAIWLKLLGAEVTGFALPPEIHPNLFEATGVADGIISKFGDVRDLASVTKIFADHSPEIVIHSAAQPLVRRSYRDPVETYATNIMGTVHVLEAARTTPSVRSVVLVTSDKCYENREWARWATKKTMPWVGMILTAQARVQQNWWPPRIAGPSLRTPVQPRLLLPAQGM